VKKLLFISILLVSIFQLKAQYNNQTTEPDSLITIRHYHRQNNYQINNKALSNDYLLSRLMKFRSSADELNRSKIHLTLSFIFLGAFVISYIVPNPTSIIFSIIGVPLCLIESIIARKHFRKSINLYNNEMSKLQTT